MFLHYFKTTLRNIGNNKFRYLITTLGIAVGITIFSVLYLMIDIVTIHMINLPDENNLYVVETVAEQETGLIHDGSDMPTSRTTPTEALIKLKEQNIPEFERMSLLSGHIHSLFCCEEDNEQAMYEAAVRYVDADFFPVVGVKFLQGNSNAWGNRRLAVITEGYAKKLFGNAANAVGKNIDLRGTNNHVYGIFTVVGVIDPILVYEYRANIYLETDLNPYEIEIAALAKLKSDASLQKTNNLLKTISKDFGIPPFKVDGKEMDRYIQLSDIQRYKLKIPASIRAIALLLASVVLLIALFNFFSLLVSSVQARIQQFTLRKIVGANQWTFLLMFLFEIIPILIGALLVNYVFIELLLGWYQSSSLVSVEFRQIDPFKDLVYIYPLRVVLYTFLVCLGLALLLTFRIQKIILVQGIRGKLLNANRNFLRNGLVFFQLLFTLLFLSISVELFRIVSDGLQDFNRTLSTKQEKAIFILTSQGKWGIAGKEEEVLSRIKQIPGVEEVVLDNGYKTYSEGRGVSLSNQKYLPATNVIRFEGYDRFFEINDPALQRSLAPDEAIVNEALARVLAENDETNIAIFSQTFKVVGTVSQIPYTEKNKLAYLTSSAIISSQNKSSYIKCHPAQAREARKQIMEIIREYVPETIPYQLPTFYEITQRYNSVLRGVVGILGIATFMSLILTLFGIYSTVSFDAKRRRKENAIRKINGATYRNILWRYLKKYAIMLIVVLGLLFPLHTFTIRTTGIESPDGTTFRLDTVFITWCVLSLFVLFTIYNLIRQATKENPAEVIKSE